MSWHVHRAQIVHVEGKAAAFGRLVTCKQHLAPIVVEQYSSNSRTAVEGFGRKPHAKIVKALVQSRLATSRPGASLFRICHSASGV
eukprot:6213184-Pleurochrysis_carterae.AAC.3